MLDLETNKLMTITPDILVKKRCNVVFDPSAACPRFEQFIDEIHPNKDIQGFLQRLLGYCLTGRVDEQIVSFFHGSGANGKSVLIEFQSWLLGDYAHKMQTETLMAYKRNPQAPSPDIVGLMGVRLAYANETEEGSQLAAAHIKDLTGGDTEGPLAWHVSSR